MYECMHACASQVTPELGRWASVGGLGTMVDHFSAALAATGAEVSVIVPAYTCYASRWRHIPVKSQSQVPIGHSFMEVNVRYVLQDGVSIYLLECAAGFMEPYPKANTTHRLLPAVLLARASLVCVTHTAFCHHGSTQV